MLDLICLNNLGTLLTSKGNIVIETVINYNLWLKKNSKTIHKIP